MLVTSTGWISVFGQQYHRNRWASMPWTSLPSFSRGREDAPRGPWSDNSDEGADHTFLGSTGHGGVWCARTRWGPSGRQAEAQAVVEVSPPGDKHVRISYEITDSE